MPLSRERAVDLSHRIVERLVATPGTSLIAEREYVRNQILRALLLWEKENDKLASAARAKLAARGRKIAEGSREWDLVFAEEMERAYTELLGRGE